ncbi:hypothetical protein D3C83_218810 [compost metagenome]
MRLEHLHAALAQLADARALAALRQHNHRRQSLLIQIDRLEDAIRRRTRQNDDRIGFDAWLVGYQVGPGGRE